MKDYINDFDFISIISECETSYRMVVYSIVLIIILLDICTPIPDDGNGRQLAHVCDSSEEL